MTEKIKQKGSLGSIAEDLFVELFCDTFGPDQADYLFLQYPVTDIYGHRRSIDFVKHRPEKVKDELRIMLGIRKPWYSARPYTTLRRFLPYLRKWELNVRLFPVHEIKRKGKGFRSL